MACCSANKSPARALESALAAPLATCATSTAAVAANGVVAIVIASAAAHARSAPFARAIAHAPRDERERVVVVVARTGVVVARRAAIMSRGVVVFIRNRCARACVREVTSVRSRVDRTRRNVRVTNARVRVCGTAVEDASSRIDATTRDVVDRTLARVGRPHGPTVGPGPPGCVDTFVSHDR